MALTAATVQAAYTSMRSALPCAGVKVRHKESGAVYDGVRGSLESSMEVGSMGSIQGADGAVRLNVSELVMPHPEAGDLITVQEQGTGDEDVRVVLAVRYDQARATVRIDYGAEYD